MLQSPLFLTSLGPMSEERKVAEFINLLTGKELFWATVFWEARYEVLSSFEHFQQLFRHVFEHAP